MCMGVRLISMAESLEDASAAAEQGLRGRRRLIDPVGERLAVSAGFGSRHGRWSVSIRKRGPHHGRLMSFAVRRLAIVTLSDNAQPLHSPNHCALASEGSERPPNSHPGLLAHTHLAGCPSSWRCTSSSLWVCVCAGVRSASQSVGRRRARRTHAARHEHHARHEHQAGGEGGDGRTTPVQRHPSSRLALRSPELEPGDGRCKQARSYHRCRRLCWRAISDLELVEIGTRAN